MVFFTQSNEKTFKISSDSYFKSDLKNEKKLDLSIKTTAERIFWRRFYRSWNSVVIWLLPKQWIFLSLPKRLENIYTYWAHQKIEFFSHQKSIICNECCFGGGVIQSPNQIAILPYNILDCHERYAPTL